MGEVPEKGRSPRMRRESRQVDKRTPELLPEPGVVMLCTHVFGKGQTKRTSPVIPKT